MKKYELLYSSKGVKDHFATDQSSFGDHDEEEEWINFWLRVQGEVLFYWSPLRGRWIDIKMEHRFREDDIRRLILKLLQQSIDNEAVEVQALPFLLNTGQDLNDTLPEELRPE